MKILTKQLFLPTALTLIAVAILCTLGNWQLQRLEWKNGLQNEWNEATNKNPKLGAKDLNEDFTFKHGKIRGKFLRGTNILIIPRTHKGKTGGHLYSAFRMDDWHVVFVNRGWVPQDYSNDKLRFNRQTLTGTFKKPPQPNKFTPANNIEKNEWFQPNIDDMAKTLPKNNAIIPYIFALKEGGGKETYPLKEATQMRMKNNHLYYAIFWFAMAGVLLVIYGLRFLRPERTPS